MGCIIRNSKDRTAYTLSGQPDTDPETGLNNKVIIGSSRFSFPIREDMRLQIMKIVRKVLQVDSRSDTPFKNVRYPREEGKKKAILLEARKNWLVSILKQSKKEAQAFAMAELENFFQQEDFDVQDPLGSLTEVIYVKLNKRLDRQIEIFYVFNHYESP